MPQQRRLLQNPAFIVLEIIISTHAPTGRLRLPASVSRLLHWYFNPRPPTGATSRHGQMFTSPERFQSTPQQGRLPHFSSQIKGFFIFQSTPQQGRLRLIGFFSPYQGDFNPRPNRGDFQEAADTDTRLTISIHAPTGATSNPPETSTDHLRNFNPRPNRGDFRTCTSRYYKYLYFNPRPNRGDFESYT